MPQETCFDSNTKCSLKIPDKQEQSYQRSNKGYFESECFRCIQVINFSTYWLFMNPYKIVLPTGPGKEVCLVSSVWRKIMFVIIQVAYLSIEKIPQWLDTFIGKNVSEDPIVLYTFVATTGWTMVFLVWPVVICTKRQSYLKLLNCSYKLHSETKSHIWKTKIVRWVVFSCILLTLTGIGFGLENGATAFPEKLQLLILSQLNNLPIIREIIYVIIQVLAYYLCLLNWAVFLPSTCACLVMYELSTKLLKEYSRLDAFESGKMAQVIHNYKQVKTVISGWNEITSAHNICLMISMMAELCTDFTVLMGDDDADPSCMTWSWLTRVVMACSFIGCFLIFGIAAASHSKFRRFGECLYTHVGGNIELRDGEKIELVLMQNDLLQNPLGLKAHEFVISFSLLAVVFSSTLTYMFVLLQFKK